MYLGHLHSKNDAECVISVIGSVVNIAKKNSFSAVLFVLQCSLQLTQLDFLSWTDVVSVIPFA